MADCFFSFSCTLSAIRETSLRHDADTSLKHDADEWRLIWNMACYGVINSIMHGMLSIRICMMTIPETDSNIPLKCEWPTLSDVRTRIPKLSLESLKEGINRLIFVEIGKALFPTLLYINAAWYAIDIISLVAVREKNYGVQPDMGSI